MAGKFGELFDKKIMAISAKTEAMSEVSRNKTAMANAQKALDEALFGLGQRLYYDWNNGAVDLNTYVADVERAKQIERDLDGFRRRIEEIKAQEAALSSQTNHVGGFFCNQCGKPLPAGSRFCDGCGTQVG